MPDPSRPDLEDVFDRLEATLRRYAPPLVARRTETGGKRNLHLWLEGDVVVEGRRKREVYFAGVIAQKGYVGFYFMPVNTHAQRKSLFAPELLALLKGKSCFHVRRLDDTLLDHVEDALRRGLELYRERGWVQ
jgi:hypothetical protein